MDGSPEASYVHKIESFINIVDIYIIMYTEKQKKAYELAVQNGYYEYPKKIELKEQMKILKNHKEDFQTNFRRDNGKTIIDFLDEAKLNNNKILEKD